METPKSLRETPVSYASDSAFHALGLPDADDLQLRADLMRQIVRIIAERRLTQVRAGKLMAMDQPRVSALMNGKITLFSTDRLLRALSDLGQDVEVRIRPSGGDKGTLRLAG
jgi:predicted XRE-type DNA-binding protein